jgi:hypothetical protein
MTVSSHPHFNLHLLQAISDWQRGGDAKQNLRRGETLKAACATLPDQYRRCVLICFRQIALPKGGVWDLLGENSLGEKISSWTVDIELAKEFKGGVPPEGQDFQGVIFCVAPKPEQVVVNLRELFNEPDFIKAIKRHRGDIAGFGAGMGQYHDTQSEVVLEVASVAQEDIYSLGGHSSRFEELVAFAADCAYGRAATEAEKEALTLRAAGVRSKAGPQWLTPEATARVLARGKPAAEVLVEIKRQQMAAAAAAASAPVTPVKPSVSGGLEE